MTTAASSSQPVVVVTADSHVSPPLSQLRPYCDKEHLEDFDAFAATVEPLYRPDHPFLLSSFGGDTEALAEWLPSSALRNAGGRGIHDMGERLADLDRDGVAAEVVFHGSPDADGHLLSLPFDDPDRPRGAEWSGRQGDLVAEGCRIYNRWLADFCSEAPERHAGQCQIPVWDLDASIAEVRWAADHGLRGVNFPRPQWDLPSYEDPSWDPFFATCAELRMPLTTHLALDDNPPILTGPGAVATQLMGAPYMSGRNLWHMIFAGVFDRHPGLTLVITEAPGPWFSSAVNDMEGLYSDRGRAGPMLRNFLEQRPIDYVRQNVYFGCSFMSRHEAQLAVESGLVDRVMWGSDYPHPEGTWLHDPDADGGPAASTTRLSLANTFAGLDEADIRRMVGGNAVECYGLDAAALGGVAGRIGPSITELTIAPDLDRVPADYPGLGFRTTSAWG